ncbi:sciellin isoform X2 [Myripristis murdjan]|uniref:sciellin isoform X2 n=1 Tax=Myripristis murdjan TaxID=586833 RepID=UPI0011763107|nr:sciellin isoform X2 [Myripristis murdjan]
MGTFMKDSSWIRRIPDEDEAVDRDPNFGKTVLSRVKSGDGLSGCEPATTTSPKVITSPTSVQALAKRFGGSQEQLTKSSTLPSSRSTSYTKSTSTLPRDTPKTSPSSTSTLPRDTSKTTTTSKTTVTQEPKTSTTTTTVTKDGKTTETTITTTQSVSRSPVVKSPTKPGSFTDRVFSDVRSSNAGSPYSSYSPTKTITATEPAYTTNKDTEDQLYDTLIPKSIKDDYPTSKTKVSKTETVTVKTSPNGGDFKTTTTTRTSSTAEDDLYDTLLPKAMKSDLPSPVSPTSTSTITKKEFTTEVDSSKGGESPTVTSPTSPRTITSYSSYSSSDDTPSTTRTTSYTISSKPSYEYTSVTSPTVYTSTSYKNSRADDLTDPRYSKSSIKTVYSTPERPVLEKDMCTHCRKPFNAEAKMVLEDMNINCHASCFKCEVCKSTLGHLKAGDSLWIYRRTVHCDNCFDKTREKWRR